MDHTFRTGSYNCETMNWLFEIKKSDGPPCERKLTKDEMEFHRTWMGQIAVIESAEQAVRIMTR